MSNISYSAFYLLKRFADTPEGHVGSDWTTARERRRLRETGCIAYDAELDEFVITELGKQVVALGKRQWSKRGMAP